MEVLSVLSQYGLQLAHLLIGFFFIFFGFWNVYHWSPIIKTMAERNIPWPFVVLPLGIACQTIFGFMILLSFYIKVAALVLIPFTMWAVCVFHPFWKYKGELFALNFIVFMTNITVTLGSLLLLVIY